MNFQAEHKEWVDRMHPNQPPELPAAGCVEEAGELLHAVLKLEQERLWGPDPRYPRLKEDLVDAIGDCAIYACSLCNATKLDFEMLLIIAKDLTDITKAPPLQIAVSIVMAAAKVAQFPTQANGLACFLSILMFASQMLEVDFETAVKTTWDKVKRRTRG